MLVLSSLPLLFILNPYNQEMVPLTVQMGLFLTTDGIPCRHAFGPTFQAILHSDKITINNKHSTESPEKMTPVTGSLTSV